MKLSSSDLLTYLNRIAPTVDKLCGRSSSPMAFSAEGYVHRVPRSGASDEASRREFLESLRPLKHKFARFAAAAPKSASAAFPPKPLEMSRQLFLPATEILDREDLSMLGELYSHDYELGNRLLAIMDAHHGAGESSNEWTALCRCAIKEMLQ